jgi:polyphosphate glucokinase
MPKKHARKQTPKNKKKKILVVDVGGTHVKMLATGQAEHRILPSGSTLTPAKMVKEVVQAQSDTPFDVVSIGYPGPVIAGRVLREPHNLAPGWVGFDFAKAFGRPVRVLNDAAMQALGSYDGGRMLFLGLGTGLGSAMIVDDVLEPMELAHLPYRKGQTYEDYLGARGLLRLGRKKWEHHVDLVVDILREAMGAEYVVLGGGNSKKLKSVPRHARLGDNRNAFTGGFRLWATKPDGAA